MSLPQKALDKSKSKSNPALEAFRKKHAHLIDNFLKDSKGKPMKKTKVKGGTYWEPNK